MIPKLKIELIENSRIPETYSLFTFDDNCECYWIDGLDQILVVPKNANGKMENTGILISFDFKKSLDPDGGHEWLENRLKKLITFLIKNKMHF